MIEQNAPVPIKQSFSVPAAASTTTVGPAFQNFGPSDKLALFATLTGMSASTLDLYLQETWDGGVTWYDVAHFSQVAANSGPTVTRLVTSTPSVATPLTIGTGTLTAATPALAAHTFVDAPWGPLLRFVSVTGTGANSGAVTQNITIIAWQQSH